MSGFVKVAVVMMLAFVPAFGADPAVVVSTHVNQDAPLQLDSSSPFWKGSHVVYMDKDSFGKAVRGYGTEVRTRWTKDNLYFLCTCPYEQLHLKPNPNTRQTQSTRQC